MTRARAVPYDFWPFALLCVLAASRWMVEGAFPEASSTLPSQALGCAMAAGLVGAVAVIRRRQHPERWTSDKEQFSAVLGGCMVLVGPVVARAVSGRHFGADPATLALALVPVIAAIAGSAAGGAETGDLPGLLWPGLAGLAGLLLLLPEPSLTGWRSWCGLLLLPILVGVGGSLTGRRVTAEVEGEFRSRDWLVPGGLLLAAIVFGGFWLMSFRQTGGKPSVEACGLDGLSAMLTLVALERLGVRAWSAQFLLIPLLGLAEGMVFLRPVLDSRSWLGLGLVAVGGLYQLLPRGPEGADLSALRSGEDVSGA